jgi:ribose 5-phosphate isomerase B
MGLKVALASDHAGFAYKEIIKSHLLEKGYEVEDFGTDSDESCDYPDFIHLAAKAVADGSCECGVVFGGSGNGEAMSANKIKGIRCAVCWDEYTARMAKQHNNANVISLGERTITPEQAVTIVDVWLQSEFEGGRHQRRIDKIEVD